MKKIFTLVLIYASLSTKGDSWIKRADFGGGLRAGGFSFSIGNKGYLGGGIDTGGYGYKDFWEYDPSLNTWSQKSDCPGEYATIYGFGFSILNKGYAGGDYNCSLYEYDPSGNSWIPKASYPISFKGSYVSFTIGNLAYVSIGPNGSHSNALLQYDPSIDQWTQKTGLPGTERSAATGFSIGAKGYVGLGQDTSFTLLNDFWEYDPATDSWTQKANAPVAKFMASGFSICNKGYVAAGDPFLSANDLYEYDPILNKWKQKTSISSGRMEASCFVIQDTAYLGLGSRGIPNLFSDFYKYIPDVCTTGLNELQSFSPDFTISPNPASDLVYLSLDKKIKGGELNIFNVVGEKVLQSEINPARAGQKSEINISSLKKGIYFIRINSSAGALRLVKID